MANISMSEGRIVGTAGVAESPVSAVSWPAVFGGTTVALAISFVLMALGSGFGLAAASPWADSGASAKTLTIVAVVWMIVAQWIASGLGGYLTGRLRTKWVGTHSHEVFFRDTAHGFLTWSLGMVVGMIVLTVVSSAIVGSGIRSAAVIGSGAAEGAVSGGMAGSGPTGGVRGYELDSLFRSTQPDTGNGSAASTRAEADRIIAQGLSNGDVPAADRTYLAQLVAARTGIAQPDAQKRVDDVIAQAKAAQTKALEAADAARKAAAKFSIFSAVSMLVGAFIACTAAALGGRQRDLHP